MGKPIQRKTDANNAGGVITATDGNSSVFANNLLVSVNGSTGTDHSPGQSDSHDAGAWATASGSGSVFAHGVSINYQGNPDTCGHTRAGGSPNVFVGDDVDQDIPSIRGVVEADEEDVFQPGAGAARFEAVPKSDREKSVPSPEPSGKKNAEASKFTGTPTADCGGVEAVVTAAGGNLTTIEAISLSPRFTVKKLTRSPSVAFDNPLNPSAGELSREEIVCNLKLLSINCLEPIYDKFPNAFITNTWRPRGIGSPTSQHPKGQAADIQFKGAKKSDYFEIATAIKDLVPFDQLLLEYKTTGTGLPWIHISFNKSGNRKQVLTLLNNSTYGQGLIDLADK